MFELYRRLVRLRRSLTGLALGTVFIAATILAWPKDPSYAAPQRLVLAILLLGTSIPAIAVSCAVWGRFREARLALAYHGAPRPLAVAVRFLLDERRLAARHMIVLLTLALGAGAFHILSHWPQLAPLAPFRGALAALGLAAAAGLVLLPVWRRGHWVNALFLHVYLAQQARFIGFRPHRPGAIRRRLAELLGPVVSLKNGLVRAGGFAWQWSDFTQGGLAVWGQSGSGKTRCVLAPLVELIFLLFQQAGIAFSALVHDIKGDWRGRLEALCAKYGRSDDLYIFDLNADPARAGARDCIIYNPLDTDEPAVEVAAALSACMERVGMKSSESFFPTAARIFNTHAITLLRAGLPPGRIPSLADLYRLVNEPPSRIDETEEEMARRPPSFFEELCAEIAARWPDRRTLPQDVADAINFFLNEWARNTPDRQRGGIVGTLSQLTSELLAEPGRSFLTGRTTMPMDAFVAGGKILCIHVRDAEYPRLAPILHTLFKRAGQSAVRRHVGKATPSLFLADEFHTMFSAGPGADATFFSLSRESNHANIIACQNLPLFYQSAKTTHEVMSLLGNCTTQIFLRNDEPTTNEYASSLFGEMATITVSQSEAARVGDIVSRSHASYSRSAGSAKVVPASAFSAVRVPNKNDPAAFYAEAIVHLGTRPERHGAMTLLWPVHDQ